MLLEGHKLIEVGAAGAEYLNQSFKKAASGLKKGASNLSLISSCSGIKVMEAYDERVIDYCFKSLVGRNSNLDRYFRPVHDGLK